MNAKRNRRWFLLNLSILIGGLVIAMAMQALTPGQRQQRTVMAILGMGGKVLYVDQTAVLPGGIVATSGPQTNQSWVYTRLREHLARDHFVGVEGVNLSGTQATDVELRQLKHFRQLKILTIRGTRITDSGLQELQGLQQLECLDIGRTRITDEGLACLRWLPKLELLELDGTLVSAAEIEDFQNALPNCKIRRY